MSKELFEELDLTIAELRKENQELKKQLEDMTLCRDIASGHRKEVQDRENILLSQQKEFIKWLEDKIKFSVKPTSRVLLKSILANYKEIIGVLDEKEN